MTSNLVLAPCRGPGVPISWNAGFSYIIPASREWCVAWPCGTRALPTSPRAFPRFSSRWPSRGRGSIPRALARVIDGRALAEVATAAKAASGGADASDFATARRRTFSSTDREPPSALSLAHNRSRLWSVRRNGERVATLRIACRYRDPLLNIVELKSAGNADVPRELWWAARQWLHMHDLLQKAALLGTAPLDRATWLSMWRPYWLAKRRIPEWLPIRPSCDALVKL